MPNDPVPEAESSESAVPGADLEPESNADDEMSRYRELVGQGMKRLASHYKETETSVAVREWKREGLKQVYLYVKLTFLRYVFCLFVICRHRDIFRVTGFFSEHPTL